MIAFALGCRRRIRCGLGVEHFASPRILQEASVGECWSGFLENQSRQAGSLSSGTAKGIDYSVYK